MQQETAIALRDALIHMEDANQALRLCADDEAATAAENYQRARDLAGPAFIAAQREWDLAKAADPASTVDADQAAAQDPVVADAVAASSGSPKREAAPGVPLVRSPGMVVTAANLADFGALTWYLPTGADSETAIPVRATPYAFDAGTAVLTDAGEVATAQPSRIVSGADGLGVVPQDVFGITYGNCPPDRIPSDTPPTPTEAAESAPETPVEGAQEPPASENVGTGQDPVPAPQTPAEGSTPPLA